MLYFNETVKGLSVGAPALLFGLPAGEVVEVGLSADTRTEQIRPRVIIRFFPDRLIERVTVSERRRQG